MRPKPSTGTPGANVGTAAGPGRGPPHLACRDPSASLQTPRSFLLLNQTFYPDVVATAQYLTQFAVELVERGHQVSVISSRRAYDDPTKLFPGREVWRGINIYRIGSTGLGKSAKWKRAVDFASFLLSCIWRLFTVRKPDVVVALTSPPLISFIAACYAWLRRVRFVYWVMDLNPDEALAAGWLRSGSMVARLLEVVSRSSFRRADRVIALDRFMADRIAGKGISRDKIAIIPPWSHDHCVQFDAAGRAAFRREHGIDDGDFVVMYSGNHSPCHPLTTLLEAARSFEHGARSQEEGVTERKAGGKGKGEEQAALCERQAANSAPAAARFLFLFVGGGSEWPKVKAFAEEHGLSNVRCLPYQPMETLAGSLSAADLHVVVMGDPFVGMIHPCKVYNILSVGAPILYIGPVESHIADIFRRMGEGQAATSKKDGVTEQKAGASPHLKSATLQVLRCTFSVRHGDVAGLVRVLREAASCRTRGDERIYREVSGDFSRDTLLKMQIELVESLERSHERT